MKIQLVFLILTLYTYSALGQLSMPGALHASASSPPSGSPGPGYPISDTDNTGVWGTAPLWSKIDDVPGSGDADFVSISGPNGSSFTVRLTNLSDPGSDANHVLRVRASKASGGADYDVVAELRQGYVNESSQGTLIVTGNYTVLATSAETRTTNLTTGQAGTITDYSNLYVRITGNKNGGGGPREVFVYSIELTTQ